MSREWSLELCGDVLIAGSLADSSAITCLTVARDCQQVFVGDSRGRVYRVALPDSEGKQTHHWVKDSMVSTCMGCSTRFSFSERRHHCRQCGKVYCGACTNYETSLPALNIFKPVRVCAACYTAIQNPPSTRTQTQSTLLAALASVNTTVISPSTSSTN